MNCLSSKLKFFAFVLIVFLLASGAAFAQDVYVTDIQNNRIQKFTSSGNGTR